jgi:hypothetical protein
MTKLIHQIRSHRPQLRKWGVIKQRVSATDLVTNELIDEINKFDPSKIASEAKAYKPR